MYLEVNMGSFDFVELVYFIVASLHMKIFIIVIIEMFYALIFQ